MADTIEIIQGTATVVEVAAPTGPQGPQGPKGDPGDVSGSVAWDNVTDKPATFTPSAHTHELDELDASGATDGYVLTAVGDGTAAWEAATGGVTSVTGTAPIVSSGGTTPAISISVGTTAGTVAAGDDARLSDSRNPTAHAASHAAAGSDPLFDQNLNTTDGVTFGQVTTPTFIADEIYVGESGIVFDGLASAANTRANLGLGDAATANIGTGSTQVAAGNHGHGNINSSGLVGTTANLPLKTGTGGIVEAGAFGVNAGEFAEGNHTHADLHARSHAITSTSDHTAGNHKVFYSNGSGEIVELALGNSGEVLTSNGATSAPSFAAASGGIGGSTGGTDGAVLRADGTGGSTAQGSGLQLDDAVRAFSVTGDASTDVITATGHDYVNGQVIRFVGLAGGSGLSNATNYFVRDAATNEFKVATTSGGAAVNFTTNITSGSAIALQENVTLRVRPAKFAFTADASTDVITATGHTFIEHDPVSFSELVGGAGLNTAVVYYVRDISGDTFKISTSAGGTATNITTNYTGGNVELVAALVLTTPNMGSFIVGPKPDGTTHGGNIRGQGVIDIQPTRSGNTATRVASGIFSIAIGDGLTASNTRAITIGSNGTTASGINSLAIGTGNTASARNSIAMGVAALADRSGRAFCHHSSSASGHRQELQFLLTRTTTNDTAVEMWADESESARVTIPSGKVMGGIVCVTGSKSDGSAVALYTRQFVIKNVGGTTTLLSSSTIGTDYEDNANTDITVEANDTNDALRVLVKGISGETWRYTGWLHCTEHFYGT